LLDTAGQEEYSSMRDQYYRTADAFVIAYSITSKNSFDEAAQIYDQILRVKDSEKVPVVLIGNKNDLETQRQVTIQQGRDLANSWKAPFFETSAKFRINIDECFHECVRITPRRGVEYKIVIVGSGGVGKV